MPPTTRKKRSITVDDLLKRQEEGFPRTAKRQKVMHLSRRKMESDEDAEGSEASGSDDEMLNTMDDESEEETGEDGEEESEDGNEENSQKADGGEDENEDEDGGVDGSDDSDEGEDGGVDVYDGPTQKPFPAFEVQDRLGSSIKKKPNLLHPAPQKSQVVVKSFASFGISPALVAALTSMSIKVPTEVQAACIPPLLAGARVSTANPPPYPRADAVLCCR